MRIQSHFKLFAFIIFLFFALVYFLLHNFVTKQFYQKAEEVTKTLIFAVESIEEEIDKTLTISSLLVADKLKNKEIKSDLDLQELASKIGVTTISILSDKTGKFIFTSSGNFSREHSFYQDLSLLDLNQCSTQMCDGKLCRTPKEIANCKMKRSEVLRIVSSSYSKKTHLPIYMPPLYSDVKNTAPVKWIVSHNPALGVIIDIFYSKKELDKILSQFLQIHAGYLKYVLITDANGNKVLEEGKPSFGALTISLPMNRKWEFQIDGQKVIYNYNIVAEFSKKDLYFHLAITFALFFIIILLSVFALSIFRLKMWDRDDLIHALKDIIKNK
jgi:hypothetical protein